jgi:class 3 adenylate cyclase
MRIGTVFIVVGAIVIAALVAIIASFAVVDSDAVEKAFTISITNEVSYLRASIEQIGLRVKSTAKVIREWCLAHKQHMMTLPAAPLAGVGVPQPEFGNFSGVIDLLISALQSDPVLAYVYFTGRSASPDAYVPEPGMVGAPYHWDSFGVGWGLDGDPNKIQLQVPDMLQNSSIFAGEVPMTNFTAIHVYDESDQSPVKAWVEGTDALREDSFELGTWFKISSFNEPETGIVYSLASFILPVTFDPVTGACTQSLGIDSYIDSIALQLARMANKGNRLFLIDARNTSDYVNAIIAHSLPPSELPFLDVNTSVSFEMTQTPNAGVNALMRLVVEKLGGVAGVLNASGDFVFEHPDDDTVIAIGAVTDDAGMHFLVVSQTPLSYYLGNSRATKAATIGIGCAVMALCVLAFVLVHRSIAGGLSDVAVRMQQAAQFEEADSAISVSQISEVKALQDAFADMNSELQRIKGFVPRAVLYATKKKNSDDAAAEQAAAAEEAARAKGRTADGDEEEDGTRSKTVDSEDPQLQHSPGHTPRSHMNIPTARAANDPIVVAISNKTANGAAAVPLQQQMASPKGAASVTTTRYSGGVAQELEKRLGISAAALKNQRVAVALVNLRQFNLVAREVIPDTLVRVVESLASRAFRACEKHRGVVDNFMGDHFVFTFNAARPCALAVQKCVAAVLEFAREVESCSTVQRARAAAVAAAPPSANAQGVLGAMPLRVVGGVSSGPAIVGNLGCMEMKRFSIVGEAFSRACELEQIMRTHAHAAQWQPQLPYTVGITSRDARDVESMAQLEYVDVKRMRHVANGQPTAVARVLFEHGAGDKEDEWMYSLKQGLAQNAHTTLRNQAFLALERRDNDAYRRFMIENPDLPHSDLDELANNLS